jgi:hypothetical protein
VEDHPLAHGKRPLVSQNRKWNTILNRDRLRRCEGELNESGSCQMSNGVTLYWWREIFGFYYQRNSQLASLDGFCVSSARSFWRQFRLEDLFLAWQYIRMLSLENTKVFSCFCWLGFRTGPINSEFLIQYKIQHVYTPTEAIIWAACNITVS